MPKTNKETKTIIRPILEVKGNVLEIDLLDGETLIEAMTRLQGILESNGIFLSAYNVATIKKEVMKYE